MLKQAEIYKMKYNRDTPIPICRFKAEKICKILTTICNKAKCKNHINLSFHGNFIVPNATSMLKTMPTPKWLKLRAIVLNTFCHTTHKAMPENQREAKSNTICLKNQNIIIIRIKEATVSKSNTINQHRI